MTFTHRLLKIITIQIVVATLTLPFSGKQAYALVDYTTRNYLNGFPFPQASLEIPVSDFWIVRIYFSDPQQIADLAARNEPWEINFDDGYLVIGVSPNEYFLLLNQGYRVEIDLEKTKQANLPLVFLPNQIIGIPGYPCYRTVEETLNAASEIAVNYPFLADWIDIGDSWEKVNAGGLPGFDLMVLKLTNSNITGVKPRVFIMSAVHAREYVTAELNTRFAEYLVTNYDKDPDITWLLDTTEIHLLLQANPDGRKFAESGGYWRKNTNENYCGPTSEDRGADLNRNFEFQWGCCGGSSSIECDGTYRGPVAASEPEVQAIQNYLRAIFPDQRGDGLTIPAPDEAVGIFLDIHSYGEWVLWPWGFTTIEAPNGYALQTLGRKLAFFNNYLPAQAIKLYPTDGTTDDFAYGDLGVAAYTLELGTTFFQQCSDFENTILPENLPALIYAIKASRLPYTTPSGPDALNLEITPAITNLEDRILLKATIDDSRYSSNNGVELSQNVVAAEYYIDLLPWEAGANPHPMAPSDGEFDAPVEIVTSTINIAEIPNGRHAVFIRGRDANGNWGAISSIFATINHTDIFTLSKASTSRQVIPGEIYTYSLAAQLTLSGSNSFTISLTDTIPSELNILTNSIQVNGIYTNTLFAPEKHTIFFNDSGIFTETYQINLTFQVQVKPDITYGTEIVNLLEGSASLNNVSLLPPTYAQTTVKVSNTLQPFTFLPIIFYPIKFD